MTKSVRGKLPSIRVRVTCSCSPGFYSSFVDPITVHFLTSPRSAIACLLNCASLNYHSVCGIILSTHFIQNHSNQSIIDYLCATRAPAGTDKLLRVHAPRNMRKGGKRFFKAARLAILKLGIMPAKKFLRIRAIHGNDEIWQKVVQSLGSGHKLRLIVYNAKTAQHLP